MMAAYSFFFPSFKQNFEICINIRGNNNENASSYAELMLAREEKYIYDWETNRGKAKWAYILLNTFVWATLLTVIIKLFKIVLSTKFSVQAFSQTFFNTSFLFFWLKFVVGIFLYSLLMWHLSYKKYKELKQKQILQRLKESERIMERHIDPFSGHL